MRSTTQTQRPIQLARGSLLVFCLATVVVSPTTVRLFSGSASADEGRTDQTPPSQTPPSQTPPSQTPPSQAPPSQTPPAANRQPAGPLRTPIGKAITMPEGVTPPKSDAVTNPAIESAIRQELETPFSAGPIANPMVGDVIDVIRGRQSVLSGSLLDEMSRQPERLLDDSADSPVPAAGSDESELFQQQSRRAHAAETLLKASRLLAKLAPDDGHRRNLVRQMRAEAARLISGPEVESPPSVRTVRQTPTDRATFTPPTQTAPER